MCYWLRYMRFSVSRIVLNWPNRIWWFKALAYILATGFVIAAMFGFWVSSFILFVSFAYYLFRYC